MRRAAALGCLFGISLLLCASRASAQSGAAQGTSAKPSSQNTGYSPYEKETIKRTLKSTGGKVDPAPEGKTIESVEIVRLEVLEDRDPVPEAVLTIPVRKLANSLHYVTRDAIIRREMLIKENDRWEQITIDEIARNMRARMSQVSIVIVVPVVGSAADKVKALVITKDIWSLRLSFDTSITPGGLENLLIVPQETNLLGLQHTVSTRFQLQPETYTFGASYTVPRFGNSWIGASAGVSMTLNRHSGDVEGTAASASVGQGLYSTRTEWAWSGSASYATGIARRYVNAHVASFDYSKTTGVDTDIIPNQYRSHSYGASAGLTRSFGWGIKNNFGISFNASSSSYDGINLDRYTPSAAQDFTRRFLPVGETRVYPALSWATFRNDYLRTVDINTLALQEDYRLGHDISASVYPVSKALGSTRDILGFSAKAGYSLALGEGLVGGSVSTFAENSDGLLTDANYGASLGVVTPRFGIGRLVMNASFNNRYRNYLNSRTYAGGDGRLRGYPSNFFFGKDTVFYNLEYRSRGFEILSCQIGGAVFYDAGDAAQGFDMLHAKQSVGFGLRALFPQVNRTVFRFDLAFPMQRGPFPETGIPTKVDPVGFFFTFDQAFAP